MDDVKPCPFCGNAPYVAEEIDPDDWWFVACRTPGCILPTAGGCTSIESAIARWNRRAALASAPAQPMYLSESDLETLQDPRISGKGCFISKEPRDGFVLIAPASSVASKEKQG